MRPDVAVIMQILGTGSMHISSTATLPQWGADMSLRDELHKAIEASGKSQNQIAKDTGIDQSTISRFLAGKHDMGVAKLEKLATYLGLTVSLRPTERPPKRAIRKRG